MSNIELHLHKNEDVTLPSVSATQKWAMELFKRTRIQIAKKIKYKQRHRLCLDSLTYHLFARVYFNSAFNSIKISSNNDEDFIQ